VTPDRQPGVVELSAHIPAAPAAVWRALTDPALTGRWMGGFRMLSSWQPGAPFTIVGSLNGRDYAETGTVLAADPPRLLRYDQWSRLWRVPDRPENRAVMTITLTPDDDATHLALVHELPAVEAIVPHSRFFWTVSLGQLRALFEDRGHVHEDMSG
jgi:uncharacterized protein YndB with AHSA1/START domain